MIRERIETPDVEEIADATTTGVPPCTWVECHDDETMEKVIQSLNEQALHRVALLEKVGTSKLKPFPKDLLTLTGFCTVFFCERHL